MSLENRKPKFIRDKHFYKLLLTIALPVTLQNIVVFVTQMLDTIMLGELGDVAMSASNLANQPFFIFNMLTFGLAGGASVLTAQYWGKGEIKPIKRIATMVMTFSMTVGLLLTVVMLIFPTQIMDIFSNEKDVIEAGASYLRIISYAYTFFGFSNIFFIIIRSVEIVKVAVVSNVVALIMNASLNYVLIFGKFGFPEMGIEGAALATLIARLAEFVIAIVYMLFLDKRLKLRFKDFLKFDKILAKDAFVISLPVVLNELMWGFGTSMQTALLGNLGKVAVTANSVIGVVQNLSTVAVFGVASAAAVMIGKSIGEGNMEEAYDRGFTFKWISIIAGVIVTGIILLMKEFAIDFYNISPEAKALAHELIYIVSIVGFFVSIAGVGIVGILRGGGDTKFSLFSEIFALWAIAVPAAYFAAFVLHLPVVWVYAIMKIDEPVKDIMYLIRVRGNKWLRNVTRNDI